MMEGDIAQSGLASANPTWIGLDRTLDTQVYIADMDWTIATDPKTYSKFGNNLSYGLTGTATAL